MWNKHRQDAPQGWEITHCNKIHHPKNTPHNKTKLCQSNLNSWHINQPTNITPTSTAITRDNNTIDRFREAFGHTKSPSKTSSIHISSQNINGIPHDKFMDKSKEISSFLQNQEGYNVILWQEINFFWPNVPTHSRWSQ